MTEADTSDVRLAAGNMNFLRLMTMDGNVFMRSPYSFLPNGSREAIWKLRNFPISRINGSQQHRHYNCQFISISSVRIERACWALGSDVAAADEFNNLPGACEAEPVLHASRW